MSDSEAKFIPGLELSRRFFHEAVRADSGARSSGPALFGLASWFRIGSAWL